MNYTNKIININCVDGMKNIQNDYIASCITDPPYNYEFIGHKWDSEEAKRRTEKAKDSRWTQKPGLNP